MIRRYRAWARDVPEGCMRRDWRLHPIRLLRWAAFERDLRWWEALEPAARFWLGLRPRFHRQRAMPWGHRGRYDLPLYLEPPPPRGILFTLSVADHASAKIKDLERDLRKLAATRPRYR